MEATGILAGRERVWRAGPRAAAEFIRLSPAGSAAAWPAPPAAAPAVERWQQLQPRAALQCAQSKYPVGLTCEEWCEWEYDQGWNERLKDPYTWEWCIDYCEDDILYCLSQC